MRRWTAWSVCALLLFIPAASAAEADGPYVASVSHEPSAPEVGEDVTVTVRLTTDAESVFLTHCRVEPTYACSPKSSAMARSEDGAWTGQIPWQDHFFRGTAWVGYNLRILFANGTEVHVPDKSVPEDPPGLPDGAGAYYFYSIQDAQAASPGPSAFTLVVLFAAAGLVWGRLTR